MSDQLQEAESRLVARYAGHPDITEERVRQAFRLASARFAQARVRTFLPILVERAARALLAAG